MTNVLDLLEWLGYSKPLAEKRVQIYNNAGKGVTLYETEKFEVDFDVVIAGSRGDGTGIYVDCDVDKILVQRNIRCFEKECDVHKNDGNSTLFELNTDNTPDGYAKLRFISKADNHFDKIHTNIEDALEEINGAWYLRNDHKLSPATGHSYIGDNYGWIEKKLVHAGTKSGPSNPYKIQTPFISNYILLDDVLAFRCDYPSVTDDWCKRERTHAWPSQDLIDKARNLDVFVVPVGVKGSENEHLQWRVCLTMTELLLVQSFTDIQIKVYGALKMIAKHYLTPICDSITSYIVKTVLFWQIEQTGSTEWNKENFEKLLFNALTYLEACIRDEQLPNYMISARNMLQNKISTSAVKQNLVEMIEFIKKESPYIYIKYIVINNIIKVDTSESSQKTYPKMQEQNLSTVEKSFSQKELCQVLQEQRGTLQGDLPVLTRQAINQRNVREEFVLATFSLKPKDIAAVLKEVFQAKDQSEIIGKIHQNVFPYIREHNPYEFFTYITSMDNTTIFETCMGITMSDKQSCILL